MWVKTLLYFLWHLLTAICVANAQWTPKKCYDTGNFTTNSAYGINRDLILASLPANVSANGGFFTATIGQDPNKVYALGLCRGDSSPEDCSSDLNNTIHDLVTNCTNQKEALSWGAKQSLVRYADRSFFGILVLEPTFAGTNVNEINSNLTEFNQVWEELMDSVVKKASMGSSRLKYATGERDYTAFQTIYSLMQCTPDLSQSDCQTCLRLSVGTYQRMFYGKQGGYVQKPNCWFRWDLYPFYQSNDSTTVQPLSPPPPPPTSPPPLASTTITKEGRAISAQMIVIMVVPTIIILAVVLIASVIFFKRRKPKLDTETAEENIDEESFQFDFNAVRVATDNFSDAKKFGHGKFGTIYKGRLKDGHDVAVKRLSGNSGQGKEEFKN